MNDFGLEQLAQTAHDVFERARVVRRREANEEVGAFTVELLEDLAGDLADGLDRSRMQRERGRVAVHEIHSPAESTPISSRVERLSREGQRGERDGDRRPALDDRAAAPRSCPAPGTRARPSPGGSRTCPARRRTSAGSGRSPRRRAGTRSRASRCRRCPSGARTSTTRCGSSRAGYAGDGRREERTGDVDAGRGPAT